ncbi:MAG: DUF3857 domain-containing protein [Bacteroidota bacterium]
MNELRSGIAAIKAGHLYKKPAQICSHLRLAGIVLFFSVFISNVFAGNNRLDLAAGLISEDLKKDASAVVRYFDVEYAVADINSYTVTESAAITILGKGGETYARVIGYYDDWISLQTIEISVYDMNGMLIGNVKPRDIEDRSYISSGTLYQKSRIKTYKPLMNSYPYTIVYKLVSRVTNFISFPDWNPQRGSNTSVERGSLDLTVPESYGVSMKTFSASEPEVTSGNGIKRYSWKVNSIRAFPDEQFSPPYFEMTPTVMIKPEEFLIDGYSGSTASWEEFGRFHLNLNSGLDEISPEGMAEIYKLIKDATSERQKVEILYKYMQKKTRYVNVTLGIGGLKPYPASYVEKFGYGDCKALTNYMHSLLKVAGIRSLYTKVQAGSSHEPVLIDFPCQQFNHIILCVPFEKDSMWLECTSQTLPCGYLGEFTDDRWALLITENGGQLVKTPSYGSHDNFMNTKAEVVFNKDFTANCSAQIEYGNLQFEEVYYLNYLDADQQKKELYDMIDIKEFILNSYKFTELPGIHPEIDLDLDISLNRYTSKTGSRIFLPLNLMNKTSFIPDKLDERKNDIYVRMAYLDTDTIIYTIPEDYRIEFLPEDQEITSVFGRYHSHVEADGNRIMFVRSMERKNGTFPKDNYQDLYNFYKEINKADNQKAMLAWYDKEQTP